MKHDKDNYLWVQRQLRRIARREVNLYLPGTNSKLVVTDGDSEWPTLCVNAFPTEEELNRLQNRFPEFGVTWQIFETGGGDLEDEEYSEARFEIQRVDSVDEEDAEPLESDEEAYARCLEIAEERRT